MVKKIISKIKNNYYVIIAFVIMICVSLIGGFSVDQRIIPIGLFFSFLYLLLVIVLHRVLSFKNMKSAKSPIVENITLDFLMKLTNPVAILTEEGAVIWYNKTFYSGSERKMPLYNTNINDLLETKLNLNKLKTSLASDGEEDALIVDFHATKYKIDSYKVDSGGRTLFITIWNDLTYLANLKDELKQKNPVIAYIAVDNDYELSGYMQNSYRTITAKIAVLIKQWIHGLNGVVSEFDRDKYIAVFEEKYMDILASDRFDILDSIREVSANITDVPVTVSIGAACVDGDLFYKDGIAHQALDLALQRGGDQAVVKGRNSTEFFGGKTKTVQKRTKVRARIIATELVSLMKSAGNVIIMGHKYADHDSIGACVGIARLALDHCEKVNIIVNINDVNLKNVFTKLRGVRKYEDVFADALSGQDMISHDTLLIVADVNNAQFFEAPEIYQNAQNVVIIDHHRKTGEFVNEPKITYIEPSASSACELVAEILEQVTEPGTLLKEEAEILFSGILLDTKQFTRNTGIRTFSAALYLRSEGASPGEAQMMFKSSLNELLQEARFTSNVIVYRNKIAISVYEGDADINDKIAAAKAADRLLGVEGVVASFVLCRIDNVIHISARSMGTVNVQLILEKLNGGGHYDAAGAQIPNERMEAALTILKEEIDQYLNNQ